VVFFDVKLEETYTKSLHRLYAIASYDDYCVLVNRADDPGGMVCDKINFTKKTVSSVFVTTLQRHWHTDRFQVRGH
jgi:hypothetical protein